MHTPVRAGEDRSAEEQMLLGLEEAEPRRLSAGVSVLSMALGNIHCKEEFFAFDCHCDEDDSGLCLADKIGVAGTFIDFAIAVFFMLYMFKGLGEICDSYFMDALEAISEALKLSPDVAGATFMAAGSSAPELFTSVVCTFFIPSNGGVGTIIGSAIFNIFVIVGATGTVACAGGKVLDIWWYPLTRDTVFYIISIMLLALALQSERGADGKPLLDENGKEYALIDLHESVVMWAMYMAYIAYMLINPKIVEKLGGEPGAEVEEVEKDPEKGEKEGTNGGSKPANGEAEKLQLPGAAENGDGNAVERVPSHNQLTLDQKPVKFSLSPRASKEVGSAKPSKEDTAAAAEGATPAEAENGKEAEKKEEEKKEEEEEEEDGPKSCIDRFDPISRFWEITMPSKERYWILFIISVLWIMILSYVMVDAVDRMGKIVGIPIFVMALLFLAAGTSIPDALASIAVAKQGEGNMAISNALGSNVFDILLGLGVPWTMGIIFGKPEETGWKEPMVPITFDNNGLATWMGILALVVFVFFGVLIVFRWKLNVCVGRVMLSCYGIYVVYAIGAGMLL
jgi:K+-dependent Na+/Ca+ exchanger-like protein